MIEFLSDIDTQLLLFFNGIHSPFWDYFMSAFTGKVIWVPMYASILYILLKNFHWKVALCYVVAIALTITFADQMCNSFLRPLVGRLRPSNPENPIADLVYIVNGRRGGGFGFPSCHAANSFGLAIFLICLFRKRWLSIFIVLWAFTNSYTRLYLGLHYPGDLVAGAIIGGFGGWLFYFIAHKLTKSASVRRELSFLRAIIHRPRLLLLDDPFNGMESAQKLAMEELFAILAEDEVTVLMASQSLPDAAHLCGEIGIIEKGRIISEGNLSDILRQARSEALLYLRVCEAPEAAVAILRKEALVRTISRDGNFIVMHFAGGIKDEAALLKKLIESNVKVYSFSRGQSSLENLLEREISGGKGRR